MQYLDFIKTSMFNKILYSNDVSLSWQVTEVQIKLDSSLFGTEQTNCLFLNFLWRHLRYFGDTSPIV